ncbi:MAG: phage baseplate protein, partial [Chloroflexota bacterium]
MRPPLGQAMAILAAACPEMATAELAALSVGERDARLLALREGTFGPRLDGLAECPRCREPLEFTLHTPDLRARPP